MYAIFYLQTFINIDILIHSIVKFVVINYDLEETERDSDFLNHQNFLRRINKMSFLLLRCSTID